MVKGKHGFTIIEVAIFLVITGALFVSVTVGVQNSISQQRANDSTQNFVEFLRGIYSQTMNVQSADTGRSEDAIYGKLVTFGESVDLGGESVDTTDKNSIFTYDVVGSIDGDVKNRVLGALSDLGANVIVQSGDGVRVAGIAEGYTPRWAARIEPICGASKCDYTPVKMSLLIVRHPRSGMVYTYVLDGEAIEVNKAVKELTSLGEVSKEAIAAKNPLLSHINNTDSVKQFELRDADFCINPYGDVGNTTRTDIRLPKGARNSSSIEIIADFSSDVNRCVK